MKFLLYAFAAACVRAHRLRKIKQRLKRESEVQHDFAAAVDMATQRRMGPVIANPPGSAADLKAPRALLLKIRNDYADQAAHAGPQRFAEIRPYITALNLLLDGKA